MKGTYEACTNSLRSRFSCRNLRVLRWSGAAIAVSRSRTFAAAAENGKAVGPQRSALMDAFRSGFCRIERRRLSPCREATLQSTDFMRK